MKKDGRNTNFAMIPLVYLKKGGLSVEELQSNVLQELIDYADYHDMKWEYKTVQNGYKIWHVWTDNGFLHGFKTGHGIMKILANHGLGLRNDAWGNLVLCEV